MSMVARASPDFSAIVVASFADNALGWKVAA
jgi:hypothetical protein